VGGDVNRDDRKPDEVTETPSSQVVRQSLSMVWLASPRQVVLVVGLEVVSAVLLLSQLLIGREILTAGLDSGGAADALDEVVPELLVLVAVTACSGLVSTAAQGRKVIVSQLVERLALDRVLHRASSVRLEEFDDPGFHDRLRRAEEAAQFRPWQLASGLLGGIGSVTSSAGILVAMLVVEPLLVPLAVVAYIPLGLVMRQNSRTILRLTVSHTDEDRERLYLQRIMTDRRAAPELRNYRLSVPFLHRYDELYDRHLDRQRWLFRQQMRRSLIANSFSALVIALAIGLVAYLAGQGGELSLADAGVVAVAIAQLGTRFRALSSNGSALYESTLFLADYFAFAAPDRAPRQQAVDIPDSSLDERIEVRDVSFRYPGTLESAVDGVDLELRRGETVAIIGPSGSGKTTLVKLLAGLYAPTRGSITWDGVDLRDLSPDARAARATAVFQDFTKFELSGRTNIAAADISRSDDDQAVTHAAAAGGVDADLRALKNGYDTRLSPSYDEGVDLSEGQWQRVAIARAFFRPTPLIILDEPTASLDARAEHHVLHELRTHWSDHTIVLVTHRIANACVADRILVMEGGRVIEDGSPVTLAAAGGVFAEFAALQGVSVGAQEAGD
jgi:ATP-binding cassette subfamily B protein